MTQLTNKKMMNDENLIKHLKRINLFRILSGQKALTLETHEDRLQVLEDIDIMLSPENLSCDGELPLSHVKAKKTLLLNTKRLILKLDPSLKGV